MRLQAEFHSQSHSVRLKAKGIAERRGGRTAVSAGAGLPRPSHTLRPGPARPRQSERSGGRRWWVRESLRVFTSGMAASRPISLTLRQKQRQHCWKVEPCIWISMYSKKKSRIPDHEKLHVISQYWGVLRRVSELLPLSECWLPSWKMKQSVSTLLFIRLLEVQPQP